MEINARVYAVATDETLLAQVHQILKEKTFQTHMFSETLTPCAVLPLQQTWYGFTERAEPTTGPESWMTCLAACARALMKNGAVVVEYRSPDHPDDYLEYAYTTAGGGTGSGSRPGLIGYTRATGNQDIVTAIEELFSGRSEQDRLFACRRKEKKEAQRKAKGDFTITADGVLKKYRGNDTVVIIPDGVREIGESSFVDLKGGERMIMECEDYDAPEMEELTIPDSVKKIDSYAFAYCLNLTTVNMTDHITSIGARAFEGCESLKKIRLPVGLTEIEEFTFFLCENLKSITIPEGITHIGKGAFSGCSLTRVNLPESLVSIGEEAFDGCDFRKVRIPKNVVEIGKDAFPKGTQIIMCKEGI